MNIRAFALAFSTVVTLASSTSHASPDTDAANACARALASSLAVPGAQPPSYKLVYRGSADAWLAPYASVSIFDLEASDSKTRAILARARCTTDRRGAVIAFTSTSGSEKSAAQRSGEQARLFVVAQ
jgi:hypothetical protein